MATPLALDSQATHILLRTTYGLTSALVQEVSTSGVSSWLAEQLTPAKISDPVADSVVQRFPRLAYSISATRAKASSGSFGTWVTMEDLCVATIGRALWSRRQLFEVMVELWSNHFNVTCPSSDVWDNRHRYDQDVIRANAFGTYQGLLQAVITHPAMLTYLSNASSRKENPNENLGREILELHSVGVGAFTEQDVKASTRILTGLSTDDTTGEFLYRPEWHATGPVQVLGFEHPNASADGRAVVAAYVAYLATHPATARRVAEKLVVRFVSDDPPSALVDRLAQIYLDQGTAIVPMLQHLFASSEFADSAQTKVRTPYETLLASVRALELAPPASGVEPIRGLYWALSDLSQQPLSWPQPDGYPDVATAWASASVVLARWNINSSLAGDWWPKGFVRPALTAYLPNPLPATHGELIDRLALRLLHQPVSSADRQAMCGFLGVQPGTAVTATSAAVLWRLEHLIALLLDVPTQTRR